MFINRKSERYCYKCHKLKPQSLFSKLIQSIRQAGVCKHCQK